ncbi:uncharacterized protein STEHIDRAFT_116936 [Stereum hirsutum FP-91666 SS1]|uniref:uncharacterized protein n=1 Tax=Stereum hirsutum (strain FP-91666) TaxID=721885 RepID=UPI000440A5E2|nr:uncharacterized protein STEHIDRAFT_116936 [Stereum hirsutum FP-91666 SS1]EIM91799.1 hypothetical protein STEHIDRAFT_116936 [Stereum hirsutum FP-91666 SS1]
MVQIIHTTLPFLPFLSLLALTLQVRTVTAATAPLKLNDWSVPCFQGRCAYDLPEADVDNSTSGSSGGSGSLQIWGSTTGISDITPSAGWLVLSCNTSASSSAVFISTSANTTSNPTSAQVDVRLVCSSEDMTAAGCDHLFANGAEGTLVRMPPAGEQNCTTAPFLRVAKAWVSEDQTIPGNVKRSIDSRGGDANVTVHALTLDTNFVAMDAGRHGNVSFSIQAGSVVYAPNTGSSASSGASLSNRRRGHERSGRRSMVAESRRRHAFVADSLARRDDPTTISLQSPSTPITVSNALSTLLSAHIPCSASVSATSPTISAGPATVQAGVDASMDVNLDAQVQVGVVAVGQIVPPGISSLGVTADFNASMSGTLSLTASATGTIDSGPLTLFELGIPGLSFPGILTIGPSFKISADAKASLELDVDMKLDLAHNITNGHLVFPPQANSTQTNGTSGGVFIPGDTGLTFAASPELDGKASVEAHLIPGLDIGLDAFSGLASATISLNLDASATLALNASTGASVSGTANSTGVSVSNVTTTAPQGCVDVSAELNVNAGADAKFFDLFDESVSVPIFDKVFEIFQKCFDASNSTDSSNSTSSSSNSTSCDNSTTSSNSTSMYNSTSAYSSYNTTVYSASNSSSDGSCNPTTSASMAASTSTSTSASASASAAYTMRGSSWWYSQSDAYSAAAAAASNSVFVTTVTITPSMHMATPSASAAAMPYAYGYGGNASYGSMMSRRELSVMGIMRRAADLQCAGVDLLPPVGLVSQTVKAGDITIKSTVG